MKCSTCNWKLVEKPKAEHSEYSSRVTVCKNPNCKVDVQYWQSEEQRLAEEKVIWELQHPFKTLWRKWFG